MIHHKITEDNKGTGAIPLSLVDRLIRKVSTPGLGKASSPFDFVTGYDIENVVGPLIRKDQGESGSCGGQAGSTFIEIQRKLKGIPEVISAKSIYSPIAYGQYGGGTTVTDLETQIGAHGATLESTVPSYENGVPPTEQFMEDASWEDSATLSDALTRAGYTPLRVSIDLDSIGWAIKTYGGVIWEITGQNNGTWLTAFPRKPVGKKNLWYHYMCCTKAIQRANIPWMTDKSPQNVIGALNSWGATVGDYGTQFFTDDYISSGYIYGAFTFVKDSQLKPVANNNSIWAAVWQWFATHMNLTLQPPLIT